MYKSLVFGLWSLVGSLSLIGCARVEIPDYINADKPYVRKVYAKYDQVVEAVNEVMAKNRWVLKQPVDPSVYERDERWENTHATKVLMFSEMRQYFRVLYSTYTHINVYVYDGGDGIEVELRYNSVTWFLKTWRKYRNDKLANRLLNAIENTAKLSVK